MNTTDSIRIANNIRAERNRVRLSQEEVAKHLNISTRTYMKYENDARLVTVTTLLELSRLFNCNVSDFYVQA